VESSPARKELIFAYALLLGLLATGSIGYVLVEGWSFSDGLYMTFITLTTIGFGEVRQLSTAGRIFTIGIGLTGIGTVAFIATRSVQILLNTTGFHERQTMKTLQKLSGHYLLCGYGRIGKRIADDLSRAGTPFVIIEIDPVKLERLDKSFHMYLAGDAEEESTLFAAGIERAKGIILTLPEDSVNVFVTLIAREVNPELFILARTNRHENRRKLLRAGADKVVSPYEIGADRMAQVVLRPSVDRFMEKVLQTEGLNLTMEEVLVAERARIAGSTLASSGLRENFDAIVVAIMDGNTLEMNFNPVADQVINAGDTLIILGSQEMIDRLKNDGCTG
jgi:voltage-gated potassium channel